MAATSWFPGNSGVTTFPRPQNLPAIHYGAYGGFRRRVPTSCFTNRTGGGGRGLIRSIRIDASNRPSVYGGRIFKGGKGFTSLTDKSLEATGDLGWTLDYATAWLYRYLSRNALDVADAIDCCRDCDDDCLGPELAYLFFDTLDTKIFAGKLRGVVHLRWRSMPSSLPGVTSAPKVVPDVPRICIELNRTPFEDDDAEIDDLLGAMIHQMIHAFFLVCCGAQTSDAPPDGRLMDAVHFGLILMAIRDITRDCVDGILHLIFHASKRRMIDNDTAGLSQVTLAHPLDPSFLMLDPRGHGHAAMLHDGQTHCNHDNRHTSRHEIKNWQVNEYSRALEADMAAKGDKIWDFADGNTFVEFARTAAPPSATYIELVYNDGTTSEPKRIMANRDKALKFKSLKEPLTTFLKFELAIPECDIQTFRCIYDFINKDGYLATPADQAAQYPNTYGRGPPVMVRNRSHLDNVSPSEKDESAITHVKVFKAAEKMKFEELMSRAIKQLYQISVTAEDPIPLLNAIYNIEPPSKSPMHSELHSWARRFLTQTQDPPSTYTTHLDPAHTLLHRHSSHSSVAPISNMRKIMLWCPQQWRELWQQSREFREDMQHAKAMLHNNRRPRGLRHALIEEQERVGRLLLGSHAMTRPSPLGIGTGRGGVAGLLGPAIPRMESADHGLLDDGFDGLPMLGRPFGEMGFAGLEPMLMASAQRSSFLPAMSRPLSPEFRGGFIPSFL